MLLGVIHKRMGLLALFVAAAFPAAATGYATDLAAIEAIGPRVENEAGERAALSYIEGRLGVAGIGYSVSDFSQAKGEYSASSIVEASIPGERQDELVLVAPLDSWHDAVSGSRGAAGIAFLLSEAERLAKAGEKPALGVRFVFLGAECRGRAADGEEAALGSRTWIGSLPESPARAIVYLSLDSGFDALSLGNAGKGIVSPLWHFDRTRISLEEAGFRVGLEANRLQLYRLDLADRYGPAAPYLEAGLPAVELRGTADPGEASAAAQPIDNAVQGERLSRFLDGLLDANASGFPRTWDKHYLLFEAGKLRITVRETSYLSFVLAFFAAAAAIILTLSVTRRAKAKPIIARAPIVAGQAFALYAALAAVYLIGNLVFRFDALALGSARTWQMEPRVFVGARLLSSLLLFLALISILVERRVLSANPFFYESAALICLVADVFLFSALNLPLSFPFLWAAAMVAASLATRKGWATIAAFALMLTPLSFVAVDLAVDPIYAVYALVLEPGIRGALVLAALALPFFIFAASPLLFFSPRGAQARKREATILISFAVAIEVGVLAFASAREAPGSAAGKAARSAATISETVDQDEGSFLSEILSPIRLGAGTIFRGAEALRYSSPVNSCSLRGFDGKKRIAIAQSRSFFLDRATDTVRLSFAEEPYKLKLVIRGEGELGIYDCGLPYDVSLDGRSAELFAATNPGKALSIPITVPRDFSATLEVEAEYLDPPVAYSFPDGSAPKPGRFIVRATKRLRGGD